MTANIGARLSLFPVPWALFPGELSSAQFASYTILFSALMYARMEAPMMSVEMPLPEYTRPSARSGR